MIVGLVCPETRSSHYDNSDTCDTYDFTIKLTKDEFVKLTKSKNGYLVKKTIREILEKAIEGVK